MLSTIAIDSTEWTAITTAGKKGVVCFDTNTPEKTSVRIYHSTGAMTLVTPDMGIRLLPRQFNDDFLTISADTSEDIFYAMCQNAGETAKIAVDVI